MEPKGSLTSTHPLSLSSARSVHHLQFHQQHTVVFRKWIYVHRQVKESGDTHTLRFNTDIYKDLEQLLPVGPTKYVLPHSFTSGWEQTHFPKQCVIFGTLDDRQNPETK